MVFGMKKKHKIIIIEDGNYEMYEINEKKNAKKNWFFKIGDEAYAVDRTKRVHVFLRGVTDEVKNFKLDKNEKILKEVESARLSKILLETKVVSETFNKESSTTLILVVTVFIVMISAFSLYLTYNTQLEVKNLEKLIVLKNVGVTQNANNANNVLMHNVTNVTNNTTSTNVVNATRNATNLTNVTNTSK